MTAPGGREPQRLDVAVEPVAMTRRRGGLRAAVIVGFGLVLVTGFAALGAGVEYGGPLADAEPTRGLSDGMPAPATVSASPRGPATSAPPARVRQPVLSSQSLTGAPTVVFQRRLRGDLERLSWDPATDRLEPLASVPGALDGLASREGYAAVPSPDGARIAVRSLGSFARREGDLVRIVAPDGRVVWERHDGTGLPIAPIWSPDGRRVLVAGPDASWRILTFVPDGIDEVAVEPGRASGALPSGYRAPLTFSIDGHWLYATDADPQRPSYRPAARYSTADGQVERLDRFPIAGPDAPSPSGRIGFELDPATGRRAVGPVLPGTPGPTDVRAFEPDGSPAFVARLDAVAGLTWAGDGRLLALESDSLAGPSRVRLVPVDATGNVGEPLIESRSISWASLAGARDGHVLLALTTGRPGDGVLAVLVRLRDAATATLRLEPQLASQLHVGGWLPESP